jgi:hypothetical protein
MKHTERERAQNEQEMGWIQLSLQNIVDPALLVCVVA